MTSTDRLLLYVRDPDGREAIRAAALNLGLKVVILTADPTFLATVWREGDAVRAPGGLVAAAQSIQPQLRLAGPSPEWFVKLRPTLTGRSWQLTDFPGARTLIEARPTFVKLADAKLRQFPARRYVTVEDFDSAVRVLGPITNAQVLATAGWSDIHSEYRVFTCWSKALTASPYVLEDEMWSPELFLHPSSLHDEALLFIDRMLESLEPAQVPPACAIDVAYTTDGQMIILEVNQAWSAAIYGCNPTAVIASVRAASAEGATGRGRWLWRPDSQLSPTGVAP